MLRLTFDIVKKIVPFVHAYWSSFAMVSSSWSNSFATAVRSSSVGWSPDWKRQTSEASFRRRLQKIFLISETGRQESDAQLLWRCSWLLSNSLKHLTAYAYGRRNKEFVKVRTPHTKYVTLARKRGGQGVNPPRKNFALPGKMCWMWLKTIGHLSKNLSPSQKTRRPSLCPVLLTGLISLHF